MDETLVPRIIEARRSGFSDEEIVGAISEQIPTISDALKQGFSASEIIDQIMPQRTTGERVVRGAASAVRGATPTVGMMTTGALAGAPLGPVGVAAGATIGGLAIPSADALVSAYNAMVPESERKELPSVAIGKVLDRMGLVRPETRTERVLENIGEAAAGTGGLIKAGQTLAREGGPAAQAIGRELSIAPRAQMIAAPVSATAGQVVAEETQSPIAALLAAGTAGAAAGARTRKMETAPTAQQLKTQASQAYQAASKAGVLVKPESLENAGNSIISQVSKKIVIDPEVDTEAMAVQRRLTKTFEEPQTIEQLDLTRQFIRDSQKAGGRSAEFARESLKLFDDYIDNIGAKDIVAGDSKAALTQLKNARDLWKRSQKVQVIDDMFQSADVRAAAYSQSGLENALRRQLINLADSSDMKFFSKAEQDAIRAAAKGGKMQNFLRWAGKLSPSSVVAGAGGAYIGATMLGPIGAAIAPAVGGAAKYGATRMGLADFQRLQSMMALGREPATVRAPFAAVPATTIRGLLSTPTE